MRKLTVIDIEASISPLTGNEEYLHTLESPEISVGNLFKQVKRQENFWIWSAAEIPEGTEFLWDSKRDADGRMVKFYLYDVENGDLAETFDVFYKEYTDDDGIEKVVRKLYVEGQAPVVKTKDSEEESEEPAEEAKPKTTSKKKSKVKA